MGQDPTLDRLLSSLRGSKTVVLGVGNTLKADDGVGPLVCQHLADRTSATIIDAGTVPENHIQPIVRAQPQTLLIVDAIDFDAQPGDIRVLKSQEIGAFAFSTHAMSLHLFVDALGRRANVDVYLLGVQPGCTELAQPVTEPVQRAIDIVVRTITEVFPVIPRP